ncbi:spinocerebellar ataxia type 10 protein domain-containing protein [Rhodotorula diobovata]|uniref:Ataxin-10 homolog n=1 Tax=Rhodotorula diobovata TaxID=5288 RepID=A0A5C5G5G5_9BASI|nr:spinocerebellar ataxia type 10 protein domain-containing protein [Rhodotorula diobovata]
MAECVPPSAAELTRQLEAYSASRGHPSELVQLLRAPRLGLRSTPAFRSTDEPLLASLSTYPGLTRVPLNSLTYGAHAPFWPALASAWQVDAHRLSRDDGDDDHEDSIPAILALAAFLLSLCTQEPHNQQQAVTYIEPSLRKVLLVASSLFNLEDSAYTDMTRVCCQALANLVTDNQPLASSFFPQRLDLELDDNLIQRLLASPDHGTLQAVLIFLLNSIHGSRERALLLGTGKAGAAILDRLMTIVSVLFEDETAEGIASEEFHSDIFQLSFAIVQQLIELEAFAPAYEEHALMPGFATSPTLVTLLKFLDGHLSSSPPRARTPAALSLAGFLARQLAHLGAWLVDEGEGAQRVRNAADAAAVQGVVLVLHCLCSVGMALEERGGEGEGESGGEEEEEKAREEMAEGVEAAVRLLRFSTTLLPPPSARPPPPSSSSSPTPNPPTPSPSQEATPALAQLQRTLVQFLAVVSFSPPLTVARPAPSPRVRRAQDRVRELGGLEVLLSLCQMDERNTTMREHALFALRNLLKSNQASQDYVDAMRPQYRVGEGGELLDLPPPLRKE